MWLLKCLSRTTFKEFQVRSKIASVIASISLFCFFLAVPTQAADQSANRNPSNNGVACQNTKSTKAQSGNSRASTCIYTVTWNANGGSLTGSSTTSWTFGTALNFPSQPVHSGYTFTGWFVSPSGGSRVDSGSYFPNYTTNFTLYAQWSANSYTVTWNANGGSLTGSSTTSWTFGTPLTLPAAPSRSNYSFTGWYTDSSNGTKVGDAEGSYTPTNTANFTLYAQWEATITSLSFAILPYTNSADMFPNIPSGVSFDICEKGTSNCIQISESTREGSNLNLTLSSQNIQLEATYHNSRADAALAEFFVWITKSGANTFIPRADLLTYFTSNGESATSNNTFSNGDSVTLRIGSNIFFTNLTSGAVSTPPIWGSSPGTITTKNGHQFIVESYMYKSCGYEALEDSVKAFDDSVGTKYCTSGEAKAIANLPDEIILHYLNGDSVRVGGLALSTANDEKGRDPISWILYGSNDGTNWTSIASHTYPYNNATALERKSMYPLVEFTKSSYYSYLKFVVTDVINPGLGVVQYSELRLFGDFNLSSP
jgi:uncharacterized repeat protein (TIGR02543 family)